MFLLEKSEVLDHYLLESSEVRFEKLALSILEVFNKYYLTFKDISINEKLFKFQFQFNNEESTRLIIELTQDKNLKLILCNVEHDLGVQEYVIDLYVTNTFFESSMKEYISFAENFLLLLQQSFYKLGNLTIIIDGQVSPYKNYVTALHQFLMFKKMRLNLEEKDVCNTLETVIEIEQVPSKGLYAIHGGGVSFAHITILESFSKMLIEPMNVQYSI